MKLLDKILWAINGVLIILYFISEFVAESAPFRMIIANKVLKTNEMKKGEGHRPSVLFTYKNK